MLPRKPRAALRWPWAVGCDPFGVGKLSDLVNAAYGRTPAEVALMWETAPPRMPLAGP